MHVASSSKIQRISLGISPLIYPVKFIDDIVKRVYQNKLIPWISISGLDGSIFDSAKEVGLRKYLPKLEKLYKMKFNSKIIIQKDLKKIVEKSLKTKNVITISVGPNNVHDILDLLRLNH